MKKLLYLLLVVSTTAFAQGPNKSSIQDVVLQNDTLKKLVNGVWTTQGSVLPSIKLDNTGSFVLPGRGNVNRGFRNNLMGTNLDVSGTANDVRGNNHIVANVIGADVSGADHTILDGGHYSTTAGDAHRSGGYAAATFNFGNTGNAKFGATFGNNNNNGGDIPNVYSASVASGEAVSTLGNRAYAHGYLVGAHGDDIYIFGTGVGRTPLNKTGQPSFNIGFDGKWMFNVERDGKMWIKGVPYTFPTTQGLPGSVLTNDGVGNLYWSSPQTTRARVQPEQLEIKSLKVYNSAGQLLFVVPQYNIRY